MMNGAGSDIPFTVEHKNRLPFPFTERKNRPPPFRFSLDDYRIYGYNFS